MQKSPLMMDEQDLDDSDWKLIEQLKDGRCTPKALSEWTGLSESTVHNHLRQLMWAGYVEKVHESGLYELSEIPGET